MSIIMDGSDPLVFRAVFKNGIRELTWPKTMMLKTAHIDSDVFELVDNKIEWTGGGMPPVGVEIEVKHKDATPEWARPDFYKTEIVALGKQLVIFAAEATGCETVGKIEDYEFRPVRTPDQIAAMERSLACDRIYGIITGSGVERKGNTSDMAEALYDAGLRFVEVTK